MTGNRTSAGAENDDDYNVTYYERDNVILKNVEHTDQQITDVKSRQTTIYKLVRFGLVTQVCLVLIMISLLAVIFVNTRSMDNTEGELEDGDLSCILSTMEGNFQKSLMLLPSSIGNRIKVDGFSSECKLTLLLIGGGGTGTRGGGGSGFLNYQSLVVTPGTWIVATGGNPGDASTVTIFNETFVTSFKAESGGRGGNGGGNGYSGGGGYGRASSSKDLNQGHRKDEDWINGTDADACRKAYETCIDQQHADIADDTRAAGAGDGGTDGGDGGDASWYYAGGSGTGEDVTTFTFKTWSLLPGAGAQSYPRSRGSSIHFGGGGGGVLVDGHDGPEYSDRRGQGYGGGGSGGSNETFGNPGLVLVEVEPT